MIQRILLLGIAFYFCSCVGKSDPMNDIPMPGDRKVSVCSCKADLKRIGLDKSMSQSEKVRQIQMVMVPCEKLYDELGEEEFSRREEECE